MTEFKKLNKEQRTNVYSLFIEYASIPMLILATTVLFSAVSTISAPFQLLEVSTLFLCVVAIPLLGISIFVKKAVQIYDKKLKHSSSVADWCEAAGFAFSYIGFCCYLGSVILLLGLTAFILAPISFALHYGLIKKVRREE